MGLLPMIPLGTYAICIDEVFILPQWMIVSLLRLRCLVPFPCRAGMHARSTRNEGDECVGVLIVGLAYAEVVGMLTAREDRPTFKTRTAQEDRPTFKTQTTQEDRPTFKMRTAQEDRPTFKTQTAGRTVLRSRRRRPGRTVLRSRRRRPGRTVLRSRR
jgi:hypothetical protein